MIDNLFRSLRRYGQYVRNLGFWNGIRTLQKLNTTSDTIHASVPGLATRVVIRPGTSDVRAFEKILLGHEYDVELPFDEPRFIVDAGANVGYTSIFFANKYPHSEIVAIEPEQSNVEVLCDNVRGYDNIDVLHGAVWPHDGTVAIRNRESDKWSFEVVEASFTGNRTVRAVSVGSLLQQYARDSIDILKVDIEGAEKEVFEGDVSLWLPRTKTIIIELHDRKRSGCSVAFYRAVCKYEFEQYQKGMNVIWINKTRGN